MRLIYNNNTSLEKLDSKEYYIFHHLYIPTKKGTSQIDHVVVGPKGIFVPETTLCWVGFLKMKTVKTGLRLSINEKKSFIILSGKISAIFKHQKST